MTRLPSGGLQAVLPHDRRGGGRGEEFEERPWVFWLALVLFASSLPKQVISIVRTRHAAVFVGGLLFPWLSLFALAMIVRLRTAAKHPAPGD